MKVMRKLGYLCITIGAAAWLGFLGLYMQFADSRPHRPQPAESRTIAVNNHGTVGFINNSEGQLLAWLFWIGIGLPLLGELFCLSADKYCAADGRLSESSGPYAS
jgi:hypothetical protein